MNDPVMYVLVVEICDNEDWKREFRVFGDRSMVMGMLAQTDSGKFRVREIYQVEYVEDMLEILPLQVSFQNGVLKLDVKEEA